MLCNALLERRVAFFDRFNAVENSLLPPNGHAKWDALEGMTFVSDRIAPLVYT